MNNLDLVMQSVVPMVMVPRYEPLEPIRHDSHRYLACSDGIYLEVHRQWGTGVFKVGEIGLKLPYGQVAPSLSLKLSSQSLRTGLSAFIHAARAECPDEHAAWLIYESDQASRLAYYVPKVFSAGSGHISYERPISTPNRFPVFDLHSHGLNAAFFSPTDDCDDLEDDLKIAVVVGNLHQTKVSVVGRLVGLGLNVDISAWLASIIQNVATENHLH